MSNNLSPKLTKNRQRVKAGMTRAKAQGKHIARPPIAKQMQEKIIELQRE
jgi:DNA invertase Pin-like site-specific DNA recombinase